jgi:hypothetical protein
VKRWLTVDHTLHLTWLKVKENAFENLQMDREKYANNEANIYHNM